MKSVNLVRAGQIQTFRHVGKIRKNRLQDGIGIFSCDREISRHISQVQDHSGEWGLCSSSTGGFCLRAKGEHNGCPDNHEIAESPFVHGQPVEPSSLPMLLISFAKRFDGYNRECRPEMIAWLVEHIRKMKSAFEPHMGESLTSAKNTRELLGKHLFFDIGCQKSLGPAGLG